MMNELMKMLNAIMHAVIEEHVGRFQHSVEELQQDFMAISAVPDVSDTYRVFFNGTPRVVYTVELRKITDDSFVELSDVQKETGYVVVGIYPVALHSPASG